MKIKKLITINWANLENREYALGNLVFVTGETGVGKSTMLDAIQTVMTGAKKNIVLYNAGQDEVQNKKRNKEYRTVEGYFLGEDRFKFARNECLSTIALVFESSEKERKKVFTALVSASSSIEIRNGEKTPTLNSMELFICSGVELSFDELKDVNNEVYGHIDLKRELSNKYKPENIIQCNGKGDYLNTLYGHLWGQESSNKIRSEKAARAFTNFIHAKPVDNINEFVRQEFLESKDMKGEIEKLSEAIRALDKLEKDSNEVKDAVEALGILNGKLDTLLETWFENIVEHYKYRFYKVTIQKDKIYKRNKEYDKSEKKQLKLSQDIEELEGKKELNTKILEGLVTNTSGNVTIEQLRRIDEGIEKSQEDFNSSTKSFFRISQKFENYRKDLASIFLHKENNSILCGLLEDFYEEIQEFSNNSLSANITIETEGVEEPLKKLENIFINLSFTYSKIMNSETYKSEVIDLKDEYEEILVLVSNGSIKQKELNFEIENLKQSKAYCPHQILTAYNTLKNNLPKANARMLYEFVELNDELWSEAIEGFLANNRFAVLVDEEYEKEAIEFVKKENLRLKIIQGSKVLKECSFRGKSLDDDSIVNLLKITNPIVEAYFISSYGNVLRIETTEELRKSKRGLMIDGKASSNNLMFSCLLKDKRYVFGEQAREITLVKLEEEYSILDSRVNTALRKQGYLNSFNEALHSLEGNVELFDTSFISPLVKIYSSYHSFKKEKSLIDTSDIDKIHEEIKRLQAKDKRFDGTIKGNIKELGSVENFLKSKESILTTFTQELKKRKEFLFQESENLKEIYCIYKNNAEDIELYLLDLKESVSIKDERIEPKSLKDILGNIWQSFQASRNNEKLNSAKVNLSYLLTYNELVVNKVQFKELFEFNDSIQKEVSRLKSSTLFEYIEKIKQAKDNFNTVFINDFCQAIHINIINGEAYINELNRVLKGHKFGDEFYKIIRLKADKELMEYKAYFKTIYENKSSFGTEGLFGEVAQHETAEVQEYLFRLFMESDDSDRRKELMRVADYRNYANYDIVQIVDGEEISLSRNGKNSGGQGETSYYIIRSLNLQASLKSKESRGNALETAIIDESFLKLNEKRSKEILSYLTDTLNFQVICAMPTKQVGSFLDMESSNYHIVKAPLYGSKNGDLDYKTFVEFKSFNNIEIKKLYESKEQLLLEEIKKEADEYYAE